MNKTLEHVKPIPEIFAVIAEIVQQNRAILELNRVIADRLYMPEMSISEGRQSIKQSDLDALRATMEPKYGE